MFQACAAFCPPVYVFADASRKCRSSFNSSSCGFADADVTTAVASNAAIPNAMLARFIDPCDRFGGPPCFWVVGRH
jgi:hypothetical protein